MQHSKISWQFEIFSPGFLLLTALLLVDLSWLIFQSTTALEKLVCSLLGLYLLCLILRKYSNLKWVVGICILLGGLLVNIQEQKAYQSSTLPEAIRLYPDQAKVDGDWLWGIGTSSRGRILVSAKIVQEQVKQFSRGHLLILTKLSGQVDQVQGATNYGQFDLKKYYASKNIWRQAKLSSCQIQVRAGGIRDFIHQLRFSLQRYFEQMPRILRFFSSELILGENPDRDNQEILDNYRDLGVIHILSISGLHVGIYTLAISTVCFYFKRTQEETFVFCLLILLVGIFLSAGQAGFVRASLTYLLGQLFRFKRYRLAKFDLLGLTCIIHLALNPRLMMGTGAVLSYLLALGLEMTAKMSPFARSAGLNVLLQPLLLFYFFQFNFLTVFFNMLVVPYFNWIVMPLTFANLVLFAFWPGVSQVANGLLLTGERLISKLSASKLGLLTFGKINWWQTLVLLFLTIVLLVGINEGAIEKKIKHTLIGALAFTYTVLFAVIHFPVTGQVTLIDVGQGDSILVTTPFPRRVYLIDVGGRLNFGGQKSTPQINKITIPLLKAQGISHINGGFVSHQDADHVGDLGPLLDQVKVDKLYMAAGLLANPSFRKRITGRIRAKQLVQLLAGQEVVEPQIRFNVVYPFKAGPGENEDSLSLMFKLANKSWLFTGDLGREGEQAIMAKYGLSVNYFKLGHHGSRTSTDPEFMQKLRPSLVFISAGRNNRFNHPHPETIATLQEQHIPWASTQDCGMISWSYGRFTKPHFSRYVPKRQE